MFVLCRELKLSFQEPSVVLLACLCLEVVLVQSALNGRFHNDIVYVVFYRLFSQCQLLYNVVPALVSSVEEVSSAAGTLTLMVDVNDQHNCDGQDALTITATIADGDTIISTQEEAAFTDGPITFESISAGDYTCTVTVVDGMGPIESQVQQIPCSGDSPTTGTTSGGRTLNCLVIKRIIAIMVPMIATINFISV